jgi:catechol 2,3-dioxygenase-like lactoylglutathione lyase family enzyme
MARFHHVNLGIFEDGLDAQAHFLVDLLGLHRVDPGPALVGRANWFETDDGAQVHLSMDPEHRPAARAHVAMEFGDDLGSVQQRLVEGDVDTEVMEFDGRKIVLCCDPAGNRWELRGDPQPA